MAARHGSSGRVALPDAGLGSACADRVVWASRSPPVRTAVRSPARVGCVPAKRGDDGRSPRPTTGGVRENHAVRRPMPASLRLGQGRWAPSRGAPTARRGTRCLSSTWRTEVGERSISSSICRSERSAAYSARTKPPARNQSSLPTDSEIGVKLRTKIRTVSAHDQRPRVRSHVGWRFCMNDTFPKLVGRHLLPGSSAAGAVAKRHQAGSPRGRLRSHRPHPGASPRTRSWSEDPTRSHRLHFTPKRVVGPWSPLGYRWLYVRRGAQCGQAGPDRVAVAS